MQSLQFYEISCLEMIWYNLANSHSCCNQNTCVPTETTYVSRNCDLQIDGVWRSNLWSTSVIRVEPTQKRLMYLLEETPRSALYTSLVSGPSHGRLQPALETKLYKTDFCCLIPQAVRFSSINWSQLRKVISSGHAITRLSYTCAPHSWETVSLSSPIARKELNVKPHFHVEPGWGVGMTA